MDKPTVSPAALASFTRDAIVPGAVEARPAIDPETWQGWDCKPEWRYAATMVHGTEATS